MQIRLDNVNNTYIYDCKTTTNIQLQTKQPGKYFCCLLVHDASLTVDIASEVPDVYMQVVCITYANKSAAATIAINAQTNKDSVHIDMTMLSLASEWGILNITGGILMPSGVKKTQGYLLEENILLHPTARIKALPMLDIRSNDVQASHGAKIHTIDTIKLFYMQARWLSHIESKKLYIQWYIQNMFDKIPNIDKDFVQIQKNSILAALV
jgi:hypothetical protein